MSAGAAWPDGAVSNADHGAMNSAVNGAGNGATIGPPRFADGATHFDWALDGVTPRMIDWFWSNMEKGFVLWHPEQHEPLVWVVPPRHGQPLGAIHNAPQTWADGRRQDLFIRFERLEDVPEAVRDLVEHEHVMIVAGLGLSESEMRHADEAGPLGWRVHQWSAHDGGVRGRSSGIGHRKPEDEAAGRTWAAHAGQEIANWAAFLPTLYRLYRVVDDPRRNPHADLSVEGRGRAARYRHIA